MGTEILRPQSCLGNRFRAEPLILTPRIRHGRCPDGKRENTNPNQNFSQSHLRKRSPEGFQLKSRSEPVVAKSPPSRNLVMGQVKILKRGETLAPTAKKMDHRGNDCNRGRRSKKSRDLDLALGSTDRLGPDPETVQKQIRVREFKAVDGVYAGSAFVASPPPSSVPVPAFLGKSPASTPVIAAGVN